MFLQRSRFLTANLFAGRQSSTSLLYLESDLICSGIPLLRSTAFGIRKERTSPNQKCLWLFAVHFSIGLSNH